MTILRSLALLTVSSSLSSGLQSTKDANIQTRLLSKLEQDKDITITALKIKYQCLINLKKDILMLQQSVHSSVINNYRAERKSPTTNEKQPNGITHLNVH